MKAIFRKAMTLLAGVLLLPAMSTAQQLPQLPVDKEVRIGRLPNGLTYYIRHNEYPKGQADFYIAQKVGSILEEDSQRGLAHFLEHMCFNGTTHYPGKDLINYLESVGVKFGANLNAYTGFDQTVYNISNVPVAREGVQDSCLLVLHDWANDLLLEPEEIDAERAVIHEEWRRTNVGQMRILEKLLPVIYPGDKYGYRLPIGTMEVVDNFPYQALRDYYEKWYRPDLQGIIVVGDIDVDRIEGKIKEMFSDIEMPENPAERVYFPVGDNEGTIYAIGHDPEQSNALVYLMMKSDAFPDSLKNTPAYYANNYVEKMITSMLNTRLAEISARPDAPFAFAQTDFGDYMVASTKEALTLIALAKDGNLPEAIAATYRELLRAVRGGFTVTEYERARNEYLSRIERAYNNRNQRESSAFVNEYVNNFLKNEPIPSIEDEYPMLQMIARSVPVQAINQTMAQIATDKNRVLLALLPEKEGASYPTDKDFADALAAVDGETIEPFVDEVKAEPLIPSLPAPGFIAGDMPSQLWGAQRWVLSNGATVIVKPTKFKEDEILFNAVANGGYSTLDSIDINSLRFMNAALEQSGLGTYSNTDLQKYLAGKQAGVAVTWLPFARSISGNTTPKDLPTLMELIYMTFTDINFTPEEFEALQKTYEGLLHNQESSPDFIFSQKIQQSLFSEPIAQGLLTVEAVKSAKREEIIRMSKAMTANAADYTFIFVGNVDVDSLRPLVEKYIATLPSDKANAVKSATPGAPFEMMKGNHTFSYTAPMQTPQTWVLIADWADMPFTPKNQKLASMAGQILSRRLNDIVREKEGAVYSIGASGGLSRMSANPLVIESAFPMKPEMKDKVLEIIRAQFDDMSSNISQEELARVKEYMVKALTEGKERNGSWLTAIAGWSRDDIDTFNGDVETVNSITADDIKQFMKDVAGQDNYITVVLEPAE
ncbi:MAG: insulinase family protein [Bacteroides sp.]|nr:insulinase family protein [Bacteroides sp.]